MSTVVTSCMSKLLRAKLTTVGTIVNDVLEVGKDHVHGIWVSDPLLSVLYGWVSTVRVRHIYTVRKYSTYYV